MGNSCSAIQKIFCPDPSSKIFSEESSFFIEKEDNKNHKNLKKSPNHFQRIR